MPHTRACISPSRCTGSARHEAGLQVLVPSVLTCRTVQAVTSRCSPFARTTVRCRCHSVLPGRLWTGALRLIPNVEDLAC